MSPFMLLVLEPDIPGDEALAVGLPDWISLARGQDGQHPRKH